MPRIFTIALISHASVACGDAAGFQKEPSPIEHRQKEAVITSIGNRFTRG
jgi:hypothetical protein